jgi:MFS family permease
VHPIDHPVNIAPQLYTRQFFMLCLSSFLFFMSFYLIIPELNAYITMLGGEKYAWLNITLFSLAAMLSRPLSGRMADRIGRIPVMVIGAVICFIVGLMYSALDGLLAFLILRFVHGFSAGFKPTGTTAYMADIIPSGRRGEGVGLLGMAGSLGMAAGPPLGSWIALEFGYSVMFYTSSAVAILSIVVIAGMKETLPDREKFTLKTLLVNPSDVFDARVIAPSVVMFLSVASFGMTTFMVPDLSDHLGIANRGTFFTIYVGISVVMRLISGRLSDHWGRVVMLRIGVFFLVVGMTCIAFSTSAWMLYASAVVFGFANGINSPTVFAWVMDLAGDTRRGRATSSLFIALEAGIMAGVVLAGAIYQNNTDNFQPAFLAGGAMASTALIYLFFQKRR